MNLTPEKLQKYIEYYENKVPCCDDGAWLDKYKLRMLKEEQRLPHVYDGCFCPSNFGILDALHEKREA